MELGDGLFEAWHGELSSGVVNEVVFERKLGIVEVINRGTTDLWVLCDGTTNPLADGTHTFCIPPGWYKRISPISYVEPQNHTRVAMVSGGTPTVSVHGIFG